MFDDITEFVGNLVGTIFPSRSASVLKKLRPYVETINALEPKFAGFTDAQLKEKTKEFRNEIAKIREKDLDGYEVEKYLDSILPEAFAMVREAGKRTLGMRHFDVQLIGGMVLHGLASPNKPKQNRGMISEMVTGEGKTLVATLPSYLNALQRLPNEYAFVHVVTVNDYLAKRDSDWNRPLFELLGMTCGAIQSNMDSWERHEIYARDIVYGTNSEFGFDYLRDNMKTEPEKQVQRDRHFAIVDEVDSILIDEARTPLIISGAPEGEELERYHIAAKLAQHLTAVTDEEKTRIDELRIHQQFEEPKSGHYMVDEKDHTVTLTAEGIRESERYLGIDNFYSGKYMDWPHFIDNALKAKELYKKEVQYVVDTGRDGDLEVIIVDEFTGRKMFGRRWSDGLHQAVEAKELLAGEKIKMEAESHTLATITIQNYFKMYKKLGGMTGTAVTESREFGQIYKLEVASIPTNRPMRRLNFPDVIYGTEPEKWEAICQEIEDVHATGRPILVGTTSVEKSERLAGLLERRGMRGKFEVLNAKQHAREAIIVDKAGQLGAITVATNMAGRGTDIVLGRFTKEDMLKHWAELDLAPEKFDLNRSPREIDDHLVGIWLKHYSRELFDKTPPEKRREVLEKMWHEKNQTPLKLAESVKELGGLHIIGSERHEARRIDNQLRGRSGRQGDPGSSRFFLSLDDDLMRIFAKDWVRNFLRNAGMKDGAPLESRMVSRSIEKAQRRVEEHHFGTRKRLLEYDEVMNEQRKLVYGLRQKVLESREMKETMMGWIEDLIELQVERDITDNPPSQESLVKVTDWAKRKLNMEVPVGDLSGKSAEEISDLLCDRAKAQYDSAEAEVGEMEIGEDQGITYTPEELALPPDQLAAVVRVKVASILKVPPDTVEVKAENLAAGMLIRTITIPVKKNLMRMNEHNRLLETIDTKWKEHLASMDSLREGIYLRGYAQKDPKLEYKKEGFELFENMFVSMKERAAERIFDTAVNKQMALRGVESVWNEAAQQAIHADAGSLFSGKPAENTGVPQPDMGAATAEMEAQSEHGGAEKIKPVETIRRKEREPGPNEPCPCGSGKKYKKCHGPLGGFDGTIPAPRKREHKGEAKVGG